MIKKYWKNVMIYLITLDVVVFGVIAPISGMLTWLSQG